MNNEDYIPGSVSGKVGDDYPENETSSTAENLLQDKTPIMQERVSRLKALSDNIETVIKGKYEDIKLILSVFLAGGHILIEDNPGTGKTVMAKTLAHSIADDSEREGLSFKRIQFTPDLLPMDLIGLHVFDESKNELVFKKGPLFCNVLLADEINRASPKVQSALLECMAEQQITVGNVTHPLEKLFFIVATQNPVEMEGTYPLPAAQLDRFFMKIPFGYVSREAEMDVYRKYTEINNTVHSVRKVLDAEDIFDLRSKAEQTFVHEELIKAVYNIVKDSREHDDIILGASPRGGIIFLKCLRAYALVCGRGFVVEDDVHRLAAPVLSHRLIFRNRDARANALKNIVDKEIGRLGKLNLFR